jgi:hypothetical protein
MGSRQRDALKIANTGRATHWLAESTGRPYLATRRREERDSVTMMTVAVRRLEERDVG